MSLSCTTALSTLQCPTAWALFPRRANAAHVSARTKTLQDHKHSLPSRRLLQNPNTLSQQYPSLSNREGVALHFSYVSKGPTMESVVDDSGFTYTSMFLFCSHVDSVQN